MSVVLATAVLTPYTHNCNTGNCYEIYFALDILRTMGLTDADLEDLETLFSSIKAKNVRTADKIDAALLTVRKRAPGSGAFVKGVAVIGLRNVTQDDGDGNTGDIVLCLANKTEVAISVFAGSVKRDGTIEKCLSNPSCKRYGCTDEDMASFKKIELAAVLAYKKEMATAYGLDETGWPSRQKTVAATAACSAVATRTAERFNGLPTETRVQRMMDLLRINDGGKPADMLCVVGTACKKYSLFTIVKSNISGGQVSLRVDTFWLYLVVNNVTIGKTQVKFNNGVYHRGKTSSLLSSWNATCSMNKAFLLEPFRFVAEP